MADNMYRSSPYDRANLIADFDSIRISLAFRKRSGAGRTAKLRNPNHQLPDLQAGTGWPVLRAHFRSDRGLGMFVR